MSCPTVAGVGIDVPGHLAFIKWLNSRSFTRFIGQLLSAHHLAIWALNEGKELVLVVKGKIKEKTKSEPCFIHCMCTMANWYWGLTESGETCKNWAIPGARCSFIEGSIVCVVSKAPDCMGLQVWDGGMILWVLVMLNTPTLDFATNGCTLEKVVCSTAFCANLDIALEKTIDRRAPSFLHAFCSTVASVSENII